MDATKRNVYANEPPLEHGTQPSLGVLLVNLGTPDEPTARAVRRYLREFLSDPRVVEIGRWKWRLILNLFVLPFRPRKSAALYRSIWRDEGSPLLFLTRRLGAEVSRRLDREIASPFHVEVGMRYGEPSVPRALASLRRKHVTRLLVLPLFPQYSGTTVASVFDAVAAELSTWRWVPSVRMIHAYHDDRRYVAELAASIRETWSEDGQSERLLFSFHGIPQRYFDGGDPYPCQCRKTARLVAEALDLEPDRWDVTFQSTFGREPWIKPTTEVTLSAMARTGVRSVDVICPGFAVDCLETLEEIEVENRDVFLANGGEQYRYIPCLNDRPGHAEAVSGLLLDHGRGWMIAHGDWDPAGAAAEAQASRRRAEALGDAGCPADAGYETERA